MPPRLPDPDLDDEDYASEDDSDFAPDDVAAAGDDGIVEDEEDAESSDSSEDAINTITKAPAPTTKRKRKQAAAAAAAADAGGDGDHDDAGFENSGDEAIIAKAKKRRKKGQQQQQGEARAGLDEDEGGEGGLIKTRSMRAVEKAERKTQAVTGPVTVDVDALWASMTAAPAVPTKDPPPQQTDPSATNKEGDDDTAKHAESTTEQQQQDGSKKPAAPTSETIKIKRTYKFAGKVHTEEKVVARDSAEARLYLASHPEAAAADAGSAMPQGDEEEGDKDKKRMPRKAFRSAFEPAVVPGGGGGGGGDGRTDLNLALAARLRAREEAAQAKATKLNTVEKSRMDWAGFVDQAGIKDELALAGRAKGAFADRQDFLARSEARREDDARRARMAGKAA